MHNHLNVQSGGGGGQVTATSRGYATGGGSGARTVGILKGEQGVWQGMRFLKTAESKLISDGQQRFIFALASVMLLASAWVVTEPYLMLGTVMPLCIFWFIEKLIQRQEVERFADVLDPDGIEPNGDMMDRSVLLAPSLFGAALAKELKRKSLFVSMMGKIIESIPKA